jgi:hypothetical protein
MVKLKRIVTAVLIPLLIGGASLYGAEPQPQVLPSLQPSSQPFSIPVEFLAKIPIRCFLIAGELGLSYHQRILLCTNATNLFPIECFTHVFQNLTPDQKVALCQGAASPAPAKCFDESFNFFLTFDQRTKLCNEATFSTDPIALDKGIITGPVHCLRRSIKLPLTQDQRVILCADATSDSPVRCVFRANIPALTLDERVRLCTKLTPSSW